MCRNPFHITIPRKPKLLQGKKTLIFYDKKVWSTLLGEGAYNIQWSFPPNCYKRKYKKKKNVLNVLKICALRSKIRYGYENNNAGGSVFLFPSGLFHLTHYLSSHCSPYRRVPSCKAIFKHSILFCLRLSNSLRRPPRSLLAFMA